MPRSPRSVSQSGYYHVTMRGNAKGLLFEEDSQRLKFIQIMRKSQDVYAFRTIAWCLMDNHVHLVLNVCDASLSDVIHHIGTSYAVYFNRYEERSGHVFQCPFGSKPIEFENQLINTVQYIHMNPERAGMGSQSEYRWSSYSEYVHTPDFVDVGPLFGIIGGKEQFRKLSLDQDYVVRIQAPPHPRTDNEAMEIAKSLFGAHAIRLMQGAGKEDRDRAILLLSKKGISASQIARMCAVSERTVRRIVGDEMRRLKTKQSCDRRIRI